MLPLLIHFLRPFRLIGCGFCASQSVHMASASSLVAWAPIRRVCALARSRSATRSAGQAGGFTRGTVTAAGMLGAIVAAARLPALTTLATAATVRKRCRVISTGVFVGGVLSTLSAWVMGFASFVARVRAGAEVSGFPS